MAVLRSLSTHRASVRTCQLVIGVVFAAASLSKIGDLGAFALQVHNFRLAPVWSEHLVAMALPWVELAAAVSLILGIRPRAGAAVVLGLLAVFTAGVAIAMIRGLDFECGCFGTGDRTRVGASKLGQNLLMLAVAGLAFVEPRARSVRPSP